MSAWEHLDALTRRFEHRSSTTAHERAAARWLADRLRQLGYRVGEHPFQAPRETLYTGPPLVGGAILLLAWLLERLPSPWSWLALVGAGAALVPLMGELLGSGPNLDLILPLRPSQNVEAIRPAAAPARRTLVITAHYDTQRASPLFAPWFRPLVRPFLTLAYGAILGVPLAMLLRLAAPELGWVAPVLRGLMGLLAATMGFLLVCKGLARDINGANDNGSGTAIALALAERMAPAGTGGAASGAEETSIPVPDDVEVRFLFTGSEEVGLRGMAAWMKGPGRELLPGTVFINLDNLGGGQLRFMTSEGMLIPFAADRGLVELARELAAELRAETGRELLSAWEPLHYLPTDALIPIRKGFPAITFIGRDERGQIPNYHWVSDTLDQLDPAHIGDVEMVLARYVARVLTARPAPEA